MDKEKYTINWSVGDQHGTFQETNLDRGLTDGRAIALGNRYIRTDIIRVNYVLNEDTEIDDIDERVRREDRTL